MWFGDITQTKSELGHRREEGAVPTIKDDIPLTELQAKKDVKTGKDYWAHQLACSPRTLQIQDDIIKMANEKRKLREKDPQYQLIRWFRKLTGCSSSCMIAGCQNDGRFGVNLSFIPARLVNFLFMLVDPSLSTQKRCCCFCGSHAIVIGVYLLFAISKTCQPSNKEMAKFFKDKDYFEKFEKEIIRTNFNTTKIRKFAEKDVFRVIQKDVLPFCSRPDLSFKRVVNSLMTMW